MISCFVDGFRDAESTSRFVDWVWISKGIYLSIHRIHRHVRVQPYKGGAWSYDKILSGFWDVIIQDSHLPPISPPSWHLTMLDGSNLITYKYSHWQRTTTTTTYHIPPTTNHQPPTTNYYQPPPETTTNHHPATTTQCFQQQSYRALGLETHATPLLDTSIGRQVANLQRVEEGPKSCRSLNQKLQKMLQTSI